MHFILEQVQILRYRYHTSSPASLAKELGIEVKYHDLGNLKGYYLADRREHYIILNQSLDEDMGQIVCAHELGHDRLHQPIAGYILWQDKNLFESSSKPEREANLFAADLLVSDLEISCLLTQGYSLEEISRLLSKPIDLILFKIQALRLTGWKIDLPWSTNSEFLH